MGKSTKVEIQEPSYHNKKPEKTNISSKEEIKAKAPTGSIFPVFNIIAHHSPNLAVSKPTIMDILPAQKMPLDEAHNKYM